MKDGKAWVGDHVFDEDKGCDGIVHDVRKGVFLLRPVYGGGPTWTCHDADRLTVTLPREERADR